MPINLARLFDLSGRVALITGAGGALGSRIAVGLATFGADVVCVEPTVAQAEVTVAAVQQVGRRAIAVACDVRVSAQVSAAVEQAETTLGPIAVLINAAGTGANYPAEDFPDEVWADQLALNLSGTFYFCRAAGRGMLDRGRGSIINISSIAGAVGLGRGSAGYTASKAGVNNLTRELALEWGPRGVRVNAIMPCQFKTPANMRLLEHPVYGGEQLMQRWLSNIPLGRLGEVDEIVGPAVFLASDAAAMVTGHILAVDGGYLAR
ncbi:MAG: SDR family oxidoreductase [Anaerolineales bacterium]|nr:SDR family oxidoreductase [Anaerolineales bacterium]